MSGSSDRGHVVVITGASSGLGLETALAFARNGDTVVATMRDLDKAEALRSAAAAEDLTIHYARLDVRDSASVTAAVDEVLATHGRIDVLVNNAGLAPMGALELTPEAEIAEVFDTNVMGAIRVTKAVTASMRERGSGHILNVSSIAARITPGACSVYASSKAALSALSRGLAQELQPFGIRVTAFELGGYTTPILDKVIDSLAPAQDNPYEMVEGRLRMMFQDAASGNAENPADAAQTFVDTVAADDVDVSTLVGVAARQMAAGTQRLSSADFLAMGAVESDEEWFAMMAAAYPPIE